MPWLDRYHFYFLKILKETLTFLSLSNPVQQYAIIYLSLLFTVFAFDLVPFPLVIHPCNCPAEERSSQDADDSETIIQWQGGPVRRKILSREEQWLRRGHSIVCPCRLSHN